MPTDSDAATQQTRPSSVQPISLGDVAAAIGGAVGAVSGDRNPAKTLVSGITIRSGDARPGDLYAAAPGARTHGANYARDAVARGAVAILTDHEGAGLVATAGVPVVVVERPRTILGECAATIYARPADKLTIIGVTGTHGKSTTTQLIATGAGLGRRTAVIGTIGTVIDGRPVASALTTPEAPDLHALFAVMVEQGVDLCAMEVSSHALVMGRVDGVVFDLAVFTNLGRDHLDFHTDMEDYFSAKAQLFTSTRARAALVNVDDAYGRRLVESASIATSTYSCAGRADWRAMEISLGAAGSTFEVHAPASVTLAASVSLPGAFNVSNALSAIASLCEVGVEPAAAVGAVASVGSVPGRMEQVDRGQPFTVVVDYAHKPDAIAAALEAMRAVTPGRLSIVFGAGGDRDRGKRPLMGEVAGRLADQLIITDDNPRSEDADQIRAEIIGGVAAVDAAKVVEVADRRDAIAYAISRAADGDAILVAGKGHESGQEVNGTVIAFNDRGAAIELLGEWLSGAS